MLRNPLCRPRTPLGSSRAPGATRSNPPFYSTTPDSNADRSRQLDKQKAFTKEMQLDITAAHSRAHKSWCIVTARPVEVHVQIKAAGRLFL